MTDWWIGKPWRQIQTNLREIDMLDIDAKQVVADLKAFAANRLMINAAGIIASYPTRLPYHFQSPYLKGSSLKEIIAACHDADIRVIARTDFSKVRRPIYEEHPDWAYVSPKGQIVDYNGDVHVCVNSNYQQHYALKIIEELLTTHDFDGIFFNMAGYQVSDYSGNYHGICHCQNCRTLFRDMFGLPLPDAEDMADPVYRKYLVFKRRTLAAHHEKVYTFIHNLRPEIIVANMTDFKSGIIRQESNTAVDRPLPHWQYSGSSNTKWAVSSYPMMVSSNTTVDFIDIPYRHVAVSPHEQKLRLAQGLANGGDLDYYLIGRLDNHEDRSGFAGIKEIFHYHAAHGEAYVGNVSKANIALLTARHGDQREFRGWFRFLVENHFLFDTPLIEALPDLPWDKYQAIIVPNLEPIDDALAARLDAFVQEGGTLIAAGRAGFRTGDYEPRDKPAMQSLGIEAIRQVRENMRSAYFKLDDKTGFTRFADTDLLYLDGPYVYAQYAPEVKQRLRLIPPHMFGPPERCYYTVVTQQPGFTVRTFGKGKAIYIPWLPGSLFHRQGHTNTIDFAADLLENVAGIAPVGGNLSPMVEVTLFENQNGGTQLLHLVNTSGHFGVTYYAPVPMYDLVVVLPCRSKPASVTSLVTGQSVPFDLADTKLTIHVPKLDLFEAIQIK